MYEFADDLFKVSKTGKSSAYWIIIAYDTNRSLATFHAEIWIAATPILYTTHASVYTRYVYMYMYTVIHLQHNFYTNCLWYTGDTLYIVSICRIDLNVTRTPETLMQDDEMSLIIT